MKSLLVFFHCPSNAGFAISRLERVFLEMARRLVGEDRNIHFAYPELTSGRPASLPEGFSNVITFDSSSRSRGALSATESYVRSNRIDVAFGFDQPVFRPGFSALRRGGLRKLISYWGAPMSSLNSGLKLAVKRAQVALSRSGPDHYIFESEAMRETAVRGRGVAEARTSICYLGVDPAVFYPGPSGDKYAHRAFGIPEDRRILYYSGHMEARKGVAVLVRATVNLVARLEVPDVHLLILGNRMGEERAYEALYLGTSAAGHVTFGGYRSDIPDILRSCSVGVIASTGWDSFTMSSLEIAATGLPLVVSDLQGLAETVEDGVTGFTFPVGDHEALARRLCDLMQRDDLRARLGASARARVLRRFTLEHQVASLVSRCQLIAGDSAPPL